MNGDPDDQGSTRPGVRERTHAENLLREAITGISVLGVVAYVALSACAAVVYAPLGVNPDEVGLGYAPMLTRAAAAAGLLVGLAIVMLLVLTAWDPPS